MRRCRYIAILLIIATLFLSGCTGKDTGGVVDPVPEGQTAISYNETLIVAGSTGETVSIKVPSDSGIKITATDGNNADCSFYISDKDGNKMAGLLISKDDYKMLAEQITKNMVLEKEDTGTDNYLAVAKNDDGSYDCFYMQKIDGSKTCVGIDSTDEAALHNCIKQIQFAISK